MHILLTGSSGRVGSTVLSHLLSSEHRVTSIDRAPLPEHSPSQISPGQASRLTHHILDLTDYLALDALFDAQGPFDGVIHLSAIPAPDKDDARYVHNNNVVGAYNVLKTAADKGVKRIVLASSVNVTGLSFTPEGRQRFDKLPIDETAALTPMDPYGLSKQITETQAECIVRTDPSIRVASLRFHMVCPDLAHAVSRSHTENLFSWVSHQACADACLLGLTSTGWAGAEAFYIVAPEICWEEGRSTDVQGFEGGFKGKPGLLEMTEKTWEGRIGRVDEGYWEGNPRRSAFDTSKAEKLLGWKHP